MIKSKTVLEVKKGDRIYLFECDPDSPLGEVYDVLFSMKSFILGRIKEESEKENLPEKEAEI